jgi:hypothetical protein
MGELFFLNFDKIEKWNKLDKKKIAKDSFIILQIFFIWNYSPFKNQKTTTCGLVKFKKP